MDLNKGDLTGANLTWTDFSGASLTGANLTGANLTEAGLTRANLKNANLVDATLSGAKLNNVNLTEANLSGADLTGADLTGTDLTGADLRNTKLIGTNLNKAKLIGTNLSGAYLSGADLSGADLIDEKQVGPTLVDVKWGDINLSVIDEEFSKMEYTRDEFYANNNRKKEKDRSKNLEAYKTVTRANRQLKVILSEQGLEKEAIKFAYRSQITNRKYLWFSFLLAGFGGTKFKSFGQWLFSLFLFLLAGYGYKVGRGFITYLVVIFSFGMLFGIFTEPKNDKGEIVDAFSHWVGAIIESVNIFHGRGFYPGFRFNFRQQLVIDCGWHRSHNWTNNRSNFYRGPYPAPF